MKNHDSSSRQDLCQEPLLKIGGQMTAGIKYRLQNFDGVSNPGDDEIADLKGITSVESALQLVATDCGIEMTEYHPLDEGTTPVARNMAFCVTSGRERYQSSKHG
jgi:hypothetical protein